VTRIDEKLLGVHKTVELGSRKNSGFVARRFVGTSVAF
jgi:hypothetical protein